MYNQFLQTIHQYHMIKKGDGIVIGVSGGPDSMSLLHLLYTIRKEYDLKLYVVHLNHQFRGKEADEDAEYVEQFCKSLGIEVFIFKKNIKEYAKIKGITFEEAGRKIRYQLFDEILKEKKAQKIAIAQNLDDQAETVMMRLMRGSGVEGLSAISHIRDEKIIRPLLDITRLEIEKYCKEYHLHPRIDQTNLQAIYTRNRIRLELIPYIEKWFNKNIKRTLSRTAKVLREENDFLNQFSQKAYDDIVEKSDCGIKIDQKLLESYHSAIKKRILRKGIKEVGKDLKDIESKHIDSILKLFRTHKPFKSVDLPKGIHAFLDEYHLYIERKHKKTSFRAFEYIIKVDEIVKIKELNRTLKARIIEKEDEKSYTKNFNEALLDWDKVKSHLILRTRKNGDKFTPLGMKGSKKLKDFFIDRKIPKDQRNRIPLLCDGDEIIWIIGYRINEQYKVTSQTKKILKVEYKNNV